MSKAAYWVVACMNYDVCDGGGTRAGALGSASVRLGGVRDKFRTHTGYKSSIPTCSKKIGYTHPTPPQGTAGSL